MNWSLMQALVYQKKAKPFAFVKSTVLKPSPAAGQVLVRVINAAINAAYYRTLKMGIAPKSKILGAAIAGEIEQIAPCLKDFKVGQAVLADLSDCGFGGFCALCGSTRGSGFCQTQRCAISLGS